MKYFFSILLVIAFLPGAAQFRTAELRAAGLTCAMCSNAIHKSLTTLKFIQKVDVDLNRSLFIIVFSPGEQIDFDAVQRKVEDAGFSISSMRVNADFPKMNIQKGVAVHLGDNLLCFVQAKKLELQGSHTITLVSRGFLSDKEYRKYHKQILKEDECITEKSVKLYQVILQ